MLYEAYLGLGSNLGDRRFNILSALEHLSRVCTVANTSTIYETDPQGFAAQPPFLNAVCRVWTRLDPFQLMAQVEEVEAVGGPHRPFINAPRYRDIDILTHGRTVLEAPHITIPHPRMAERAFVLVPLAEIAPEFVHPATKESVRSLIQRLPTPLGVRPWTP